MSGEENLLIGNNRARASRVGGIKIKLNSYCINT